MCHNEVSIIFTLIIWVIISADHLHMNSSYDPGANNLLNWTIFYNLHVQPYANSRSQQKVLLLDGMLLSNNNFKVFICDAKHLPGLDLLMENLGILCGLQIVLLHTTVPSTPTPPPNQELDLCMENLGIHLFDFFCGLPIWPPQITSRTPPPPTQLPRIGPSHEDFSCMPEGYCLFSFSVDSFTRNRRFAVSKSTD